MVVSLYEFEVIKVEHFKEGNKNDSRVQRDKTDDTIEVMQCDYSADLST